jgi:mycothiol synthase
MGMATLPAGYALRRPARGDFDAVYALTTRIALARHGEADFTRADLLADWQSEDFDRERDAWMVTRADGSLVGYAELWRDDGERVGIGVRVEPEQCGRGIGSLLRELAEARAAELGPPAGVTVRQWVPVTDAAACAQLISAGYLVVRRFWRMRIDLADAPAAPVWPEGIAVHTLRRDGDERAVYAALQDAFRDHWGQSVPPYERWQQGEIQREDFDPSLWFLALAGQEIVGVVLCRHHGDMGWIDDLGVRRAYRRRGLGMALLRHVFAAFYARGIRRVGLGVDAENVTGATRLYGRAGMRVYRAWDLYDKELRPRHGAG